MKSILTFFLFLAFGLGYQCKNEVNEPMTQANLMAFDPEGSDPEAIRVADDVIDASGGAQAWDSLKVLKFNFFGRRWLLWDKEHEKVRIENVSNDTKLILDLKTRTGKVYKDGKEWTEQDTLNKYLESAYKMWVNDVYWLVAPFKFKDGGVHLKYLKEDTTALGIESDVIELTFDSVGVTPENKYHIWVGKNSSLVAQWAYYKNKTDSTAMFVNPWDGYVRYGNLFISSDRGSGRQFSGIKSLTSLPENTFKNFDPIDFERLQ